MIKCWQSMNEYHHFLTEMKAHFDSSEKARLHSELWIPWQKLRSFDTDNAMLFLLPRYSSTGRPALNQPQILRSFILYSLTPIPFQAWCCAGGHRIKSVVAPALELLTV